MTTLTESCVLLLPALSFYIDNDYDDDFYFSSFVQREREAILEKYCPSLDVSCFVFFHCLIVR